ncbi:MAG: hypothetical protein WC480_02865 [Patescibacteria group bacterium]
MTNLEQIKVIINQSDLSPQEKEEMIGCFQSSNSLDFLSFINLIQDNPDWLKKIYQILKAKKAAKTAAEWQAILIKEQAMLAELSRQDY